LWNTNRRDIGLTFFRLNDTRLPEGGGLDKKLVPYSARHTYDTYTMEKSGNAFAVNKSMGHADLKSMEPYQHQELEPLRVAINQRNQRKKFGQALG